MRHLFAVAVALFLILGTAGLPFNQKASAQASGPVIRVLVTDQSGLSIDGALVEIAGSSNITLISAGPTVNGSYTSPPLNPGSYTVIVSTQAQTKSQQVALGPDSLVLQFVLDRAFPVEALIVAHVSQSLNQTSTGTEVDTAITVNNTGEADITVSSLSLTTTGPMTVLGAGSQFSLGGIPAGGSTAIKVAFGIRAGTTADIYPVSYVLTFTDVYGRTASSAGTFGVDLAGLVPNVVISSITLSTNTLAPGVDGTLSVGLVNAGDQEALGVSVGVKAPSGFLSNNESYAGVIEPSGTASRDFGITVPNNLQPGFYQLTVTVSYSSATGVKFTSNQPYGIRVYPRGEPLVLVQNILTDPTKLTVGTTGIMTLFLTNVGTDQARNVVAKISGANGLLANGAFTIGKIDPGATETVLLTINIDSNAPTGTYLLTIQLSYSDPIGTPLNQSSFQELSVYSLPTIFTTVNIALMGGAAVILVAALILARRLGVKI